MEKAGAQHTVSKMREIEYVMTCHLPKDLSPTYEAMYKIAYEHGFRDGNMSGALGTPIHTKPPQHMVDISNQIIRNFQKIIAILSS